MKKFAFTFLVFLISICFLLGCGGGGGGNNNNQNQELKLSKSLLLASKWYMVRNTTRDNPTTEINVARLITYTFNSNGTYRAYYSDTKITTNGTWNIEDGVLFATYSTNGTSQTPSITINYRGELINDNEIRMNYVDYEDYFVLSKKQPNFSQSNNQTNIYFNNDVTASMIVGTWEHSKESNPQNYSELIKVNKSSVNGYISEMQFKSNGTVIDTSCEMSIESSSQPVNGNKNTPNSSYEWICVDETPLVGTYKFTISNNRIYITDLNGNNGFSAHIESDGNTLYLFADDNAISQYIKK